MSTYRAQGRGGKGLRGVRLKDEDYIEHLFIASTHHYLLFFTNTGKVYRQKVHELPQGARDSRGRHIANVLALREGEEVRAVFATRDYTEGRYLVLATRDGMIKKTRDAQLRHHPARGRPDRHPAHRATTSWWGCSSPTATRTCWWSRPAARRPASTRRRCARWGGTRAACAA